MKPQQHSTFEHGVTLVELLVVLATIGVLVSLSLQVFTTYKADAQHSVAKQTFHDARNALAAGKIDQEDFGSNTIWALASASNSFWGSSQSLIPGLKANKELYVYVFHNPACDSDFCIEDYITVRHCKQQKRVLWYRLNNGYEYKWDEINAPWAC